LDVGKIRQNSPVYLRFGLHDLKRNYPNLIPIFAVPIWKYESPEQVKFQNSIWKYVVPYAGLLNSSAYSSALISRISKFHTETEQQNYV
jgi:hypothetical protein